MTELRRFVIVRDKDPSGVTGTGTVADGVAWPDGWLAVQWHRSASTVPALFQSMAHLLAIHGHHGATHIRWVDREKAP